MISRHTALTRPPRLRDDPLMIDPVPTRARGAPDPWPKHKAPFPEMGLLIDGLNLGFVLYVWVASLFLIFKRSVAPFPTVRASARWRYMNSAGTSCVHRHHHHHSAAMALTVSTEPW